MVSAAGGGALLQAASAPNSVASSIPWISRVTEKCDVFIVGVPIAKSTSNQSTAIDGGRKNSHCLSPAADAFAIM
jgi:hypothetical protein